MGVFWELIRLSSFIVTSEVVNHIIALKGEPNSNPVGTVKYTSLTSQELRNRA